MESANREDAKKCIDKAKSALKAGHFSYSLKLAQKSVRLCPSDEAKEFLDHVKNISQDKESDNCKVHVNSNVNEVNTPTGDSGSNNHESFTSEQDRAVKRVLNCGDFYDVLEVSRDVTDSELKKQYKRLALILHPDKNRAPQSDDAFKAISKAYATLRDPARRNHYDRFGEDGLQHQAYPADESPDDIFRMFFSNRDGFFHGFDDDGFLFANRNVFMHNHRGHRPSRHFHTRRHHRQDGDGVLHLCQVLPILLIILVSLFSSLFTSMFLPQPFSLQRNSEYTKPMTTKKYSISYYVKDSFDAKDLHEIEGEVIKEYVWRLQDKCRSDRNWGIGSKSKACKKLREMTRL